MIWPYKDAEYIMSTVYARMFAQNHATPLVVR